MNLGYVCTLFCHKRLRTSEPQAVWNRSFIYGRSSKRNSSEYSVWSFSTANGNGRVSRRTSSAGVTGVPDAIAHCLVWSPEWYITQAARDYGAWICQRIGYMVVFYLCSHRSVTFGLTIPCDARRILSFYHSARSMSVGRLVCQRYYQRAQLSTALCQSRAW